MARLYYFNEERVECVVEVPTDGSPVVVGRLPGLPIVTRNITVSRRHGEFRAVGGRYVFKDLGSSNGCFFGGQRVAERVLEDGDRVYCGNFEVRFEHTSLPEAEPMWEEPAVSSHAISDYEEAPDVVEAEPQVVHDDVPEPLDLLDADVLEPEPFEASDVLAPEPEAAVVAPRAANPIFQTAAAYDQDEIRRSAGLEPAVVDLVSAAVSTELPVDDADAEVDPFEPRPQRPSTAVAFGAVSDDGDRDAELRRLRIEVESLSATLEALNDADDSSARATDVETTRLRSEVERLTVEHQEVQSLREQVDAAKDHVAALEQRVVASAGKVSELSDEVASLNGQIEEKNHEYQALFQRFSERMGVDEVVEGIKSELREAQGLVRRLGDEKSELEARLADASNERDAERRGHEEALSEAQEARRLEIAQIRAELATQSSALEDERDALAARLRSHEAEAASTLVGLGRLLDLDDATAAELSDAIASVRRQLGSRDETVSARETRISALEERTRGLEADLAARDLELANAQRDFRQYRDAKHEEMSTLQAQVKEYPPERFHELSDKLGRLTNEGRDLKSITEDISFILGLGYQVDPEAIKREIKNLKTTIQRYEEQEAALTAKMAEIDRATAQREEEKNRFMAKAKELEVTRDGLSKELEETGRELKKMKAVSERFSQERFAELEQQLAKALAESEEVQKANRTYLKKVSGLIEEKEELEARIEGLNTRLFDDRKQKELEDLLGGLQEQKDALALRLSTFESSAGGFAEAFADKYGDWKMNLQIVTGITEDLQDELASNPIAFETVKGLARHLDLLRDGSNELKRLLYEFRGHLGKETP